MPSKKWIFQRAVLYFLGAVITVLILSTQDIPGKPMGLFAIDDMRPWLAGLAALTATSAWNWVSSTPRQTWEFTRFWAATFIMTEGVGIYILILAHRLPSEQGLTALTGMVIGGFIGLLRVMSALATNDPIE